MFMDKLLNDGSTPLLEQWLKFSMARAKVQAENVANLSTPGYRQKDMDPDKFQAMLRERADARRAGNDASFDDVSSDVEHLDRGLLFHDGQNRSVEQLTADMVKNGQMHKLVVELLRKQYATMEMALKDKPV